MAFLLANLHHVDGTPAATTEIGAFRMKGNSLIHDGPDDLSSHGWAAFGCVEVAGPAGFDELKKFVYRFSSKASPKLIEQELVDMGNRKEMKVKLQAATRPKVDHIDGKALPKP